MNAFEFKTVIEDGVIKVPDEYKNKLSRNVKVIILMEEKIEDAEFSDFSPSISIETKGFKFDRELANER